MMRPKLILQLIVGGAMALTALGLLTFGPRAGRADVADRVVVRYWEKWTDFEGEAMRKLVGVFNDTVGAERGIYVDYQTTTNIDLKTLVAVAGGDPPDLSGLWQYSVSSFAAKNGLLPLGARAADAGITADLLIPVYFEPCHYHGELYGMPLTPWSIALYYNKDLFAEFADELRAAGLDPTRPPRTLDELSAYGRVMQRRNDQGDLTLMGYLPAGQAPSFGWYCHTWALWFGGTFYDEEAQTMPIAGEASVRGLEWGARLRGNVRRQGRAEVRVEPVELQFARQPVHQRATRHDASGTVVREHDSPIRPRCELGRRAVSVIRRQ